MIQYPGTRVPTGVRGTCDSQRGEPGKRAAHGAATLTGNPELQSGERGDPPPRISQGKSWWNKGPASLSHLPPMSRTSPDPKPVAKSLLMETTQSGVPGTGRSRRKVFPSTTVTPGPEKARQSPDSQLLLLPTPLSHLEGKGAMGAQETPLWPGRLSAGAPALTPGST